MGGIVLKNFLIFSVYVLTAVIFFGRVLISGNLLGCADSLFQDYPLRAYAGRFLFEGGRLHLWLPYEYLGVSLLGILQVGILYPFNLIYQILNEKIAFNVNFILTYSLASFFTYLCALSYGISKRGAFIAGLAYSYAGYMLGYVKCFTSFRDAMVWLPLIVFFYERFRRDPRVVNMVLTSLVVAVQVFAGHFQVSVITYLLLAFFVCWHAVSRKEPFKERLQYMLTLLAPAVVGLVIALPQITATYQTLSLSVRRNLADPTQGSFSPILMLNWIFPFTKGVWEAGGLGWPDIEASGFMGNLFVIFLAVYTALRFWRRDNGVKFWSAVAVVFFLMSLGKYGFAKPFLQNTPFLNLFRVPSRYLIVFSLAASLLCGFAVTYVSFKDRRALIKWSVFFLISALAAFQFFDVMSVDAFSRAVLEEEVRKFIGEIYMMKRGMFCFLLICCFFMLWAAFSAGRGFPAQVVAVVSLFLVVILHASFYDIVTLGASKYTPPDSSYLTDPVKRFPYRVGTDRILYVLDHSLLYNIPERIHTLNGYDPLMDSETAKMFYMSHWSTSDRWMELLHNNALLTSAGVRYIFVQKRDEEKYKLDLMQVGGSAEELQNVLTDKWEFLNASLCSNEAKTFCLASPDGRTVSMIHQRLRLRPNAFYRMVVKAKAVGGTPSSLLVFDLQESGYDGPEQELQVFPSELVVSSGPFYKLIYTGSSIPPEVNVRLFTFSTEPIVVEDVFLAEVFPFATRSGSKLVYKRLYEDGKWVVYENGNYIGRVYSVKRIETADSIEEIRGRFEVFGADPSEAAFVSSLDVAKIGRREFSRGKVYIESYDTDRVVVGAEFNEGPGFLVLADQYFPGWKAFIDGKETDVYRVNGILRGVVVPGGAHRIEFVYYPLAVYTSSIVSLVALLAMGVAFVRECFEGGRDHALEKRVGAISLLKEGSGG